MDKELIKECCGQKESECKCDITQASQKLNGELQTARDKKWMTEIHDALCFTQLNYEAMQNVEHMISNRMENNEISRQ